MKGIFSALLTPFDENDNINENGLREIVRYNIDVIKVDGLYVGGSTGENFLLNTDEKKKIFEIVKDEAKDDVSLIAQVGSININESIELGKYAHSLGYDSLSAVTPFYYKFSFEEIRDYYFKIIEATNANMIIYSIPFLTGTNITVEQFEQLFENKNIIGVKYTVADMYTLERIRTKFPNHLIYSGFDECLLSSKVLNVDGAIGSTFNLTGKIAKKIFESVESGNIKEAFIYQTQLNEFIERILKNGLYQTLKMILNLEGVDIKKCKTPFRALKSEEEKVAKEIHEYLKSIN